MVEMDLVVNSSGEDGMTRWMAGWDGCTQWGVRGAIWMFPGGVIECGWDLADFGIEGCFWLLFPRKVENIYT